METGNYSLTVDAPGSTEHLFPTTLWEKDFLKIERKKKNAQFSKPKLSFKGEARDAPPVISWEHMIWGAAPKMNVLKKQLFSDSYAFMFSKVPGALLIGTLKNTPPPLPCDSALGNEPTRAEQAPLTISTARCSHPSTNSTPFVPYKSQKDVRFGYTNTVKNNSVTERWDWMEMRAQLQFWGVEMLKQSLRTKGKSFHASLSVEI